MMLHHACIIPLRFCNLLARVLKCRKHWPNIDTTPMAHMAPHLTSASITHSINVISIMCQIQQRHARFLYEAPGSHQLHRLS